MAKLSHLEKEYIKANHKNKTAEELSKKLEALYSEWEELTSI